MADPNCLMKQDCRILRVMEHVHKEADVEGTVRKRKRGSVKCTAFDFAFRPHQILDTLNGNVRATLGDEAADAAVAAANIQHRCAFRNLRRKYFGKDARPPLKYESTMPAFHPGEWPRDRPGCLRWGGHLFQVVITDECPAADAQHAEKETAENPLQTKE